MENRAKYNVATEDDFITLDGPITEDDFVTLDSSTDDAPVVKRKPKRNYAASEKKPNPIDNCETPRYALDPLMQYIPEGSNIWESAAGSGRMVRNLESFGHTVLGTCITKGQNFFSTEVDGVDYAVTNPPYGAGVKFAWIERSYELGIPFALLLPVETIGSKRCQASMKKYGAEILLLSRRVNFIMPGEIQSAKSSAQFPVLWFCHRILPEPICYGEINYYPEPEEA